MVSRGYKSFERWWSILFTISGLLIAFPSIAQAFALPASMTHKEFLTPRSFPNIAFAIQPDVDDLQRMPMEVLCPPNTSSMNHVVVVPAGSFIKNTKRMARAGSMSTTRFIHSFSGIVSVLLSLMRMGRSCFVAMPYAPWWLTLEMFSACLTSIMGLPRLNWKSNREPARRAAFISIPVLNLVLVSMGLSEYLFPAGTTSPLLSMGSSIYKSGVVSTWVYIMWLLKSSFVTGGRSNRSSGLHKETRLGNMIYHFIVLTAGYSPMLLDITVKAFVPSVRAWHISLCTASTKYLWLVQDMTLNTMFLVNLAAFFATAARFNIMKFKHSNVIQGGLFAITILQTIRHFLLVPLGLIIPGYIMALGLGILSLFLIPCLGAFMLDERHTAPEPLEQEVVIPYRF